MTYQLRSREYGLLRRMQSEERQIIPWRLNDVIAVVDETVLNPSSPPQAPPPAARISWRGHRIGVPLQQFPWQFQMLDYASWLSALALPASPLGRRRVRARPFLLAVPQNARWHRIASARRMSRKSVTR